MKKNTNKLYLVVSKLSTINLMVLAFIVLSMVMFILTQTHYYETLTLFPISVVLVIVQLVIEAVCLEIEHSLKVKQRVEES